MLDMTQEVVRPHPILMTDEDLRHEEKRLELLADGNERYIRPLAEIRLERIARVLERMPPEEFDKTEGIIAEPAGGAATPYEGLVCTLTQGNCGTMGCIAGTTVLHMLREDPESHEETALDLARSAEQPPHDEAPHWQIDWPSVARLAANYLLLSHVCPEGDGNRWQEHDLFDPSLPLPEGGTTGKVSAARAARAVRRAAAGRHPWR